MDTTANMLSTIKNALVTKKKKITIPASNFKKNILKILKDRGYIEDFKLLSKNKKSTFAIILRYNDNKPAITFAKKISKPGLRVYTNYKEIPRSLGGLGTIILSTPKGILDDKSARQKKIGGELICEVY